MNLAQLSIRRPVFISCLFIVILVLGILAKTRLETALYPNATFPVINVIVPFPGAGPDEVEAQISKPIETALSSLSGIRTVHSESIEGASVVSAIFAMNTDIRFAEQKVIQTVTGLRSELPDGIREPEIKSVDPSDTPVVTLSLTAAIPEADLFDLADHDIRPLLEQVPQVGKVEVMGARKREVEVELDLDKLKAQEMSAEEVVGRLTAAGMNIPAGQIEEPARETLVRTVGQFDSLDEIRGTPVRFLGNEAATTLGDVASVKMGLEDERNRVYIDGSRALVLQVYRQSGGNTVAISDGVQNQVQEIQRELSPRVQGFKLDVLRDGAKPVREGVSDATSAILFGVLLTVGVVLLFLGNLRSTIITGLALPNSLLGAFLLMWIAGFSVNITTLAALALGVGLLIDDAIVVRENIFRRMEEGESPAVAAVNGTNEVTLAVVATTFVVLSVFGPVAFLSGIIGQFFREFGLTICFAMLISLLDSLTIAPMLSAYFAGDEEPRLRFRAFRAMQRRFDRFQDWQARWYEVILKRSLKSPLKVLILAAGVFALSFVALYFIPKTFLPSQETGEFQVSLSLPPGVSLDAMDRVAETADHAIHAIKDVDRTVVTVGGSLGEENQAQIMVLLHHTTWHTTWHSNWHSGRRHHSTNEVKEKVRESLKVLPNAIVRVEDIMDIGGGAGTPYVVAIRGNSLSELKSVASQLSDKLRQDPGLKDVTQSYHPGASEIRWVLDPKRAETYGISSSEVGNELRLFLAGATPARFHQNGQEYNVRVRLRPEQRDLNEMFSRLLVPNLNHRLIPLSSVAQAVKAETPAVIQREDRKRYIQVSADIDPRGRGLAAALSETKHLFDSGEIKLPPSVSYEFSGQTKDFQDLMSSVKLAGYLATLAMYLVLASLYDSFFVPFSILLVLPLAVCGAFYALFFARAHLDIYSMIGCVLLMGVAAKNSILLVDHIHVGVRTGADLKTAILRAGQVRLRPILMTSFALIAGMLPMALPLQESAAQRAPMAIAVIGGVITSTLLTLVVVPAAYGYILRAEQWVLAKFRRILRPVRLGDLP